MRGKNLSLGELAALGPFGPQLLASGMTNPICRTRGHFVGQGDNLSDKGTFCRTRGHFVGQGDIFCRTRGHFLPDKGTFLSDKGTFSKNQPMALAGQRGKISI